MAAVTCRRTLSHKNLGGRSNFEEGRGVWTFDQRMPGEAKGREHDFADVITVELLFRTEMEFVMNIARRCGLADADAEDVTQQVFIKLQRRFHSLHAPESIRPWLATITRRKAGAHKRAQRRTTDEPLPYDFADIEDDEPLPEEVMLATERRRELLDLIETIEPSRRIVLVMHVLDELPMAEVAQTLRIPIPTAYNRLRLARHELGDAIARKGLAEEFNLRSRAWEAIAHLRDPREPHCYGRAPITDAVRDRLWRGILDALVSEHGSLDIAERDGLRICAPMFRTDARPRPYQRPRRPRNLIRLERVGFPPLPATATESRTP
jgi:RNA polymerase sigma-70 factor (ECF subfamily)